MSLELQIDIWRCLQALKNKLARILLLSTAVFAVACAATTGEMKNTYSAQASIYSTSAGVYSLAQTEATTTAMQRYAEVARSMKVLNRAVGLINVEHVTTDELSEMISVSFQKDVSILYIKAQSDTPIVSVAAANAVAAAFVSEITAIVGQNTAQVLDVAADYETVLIGELVRWALRVLAFFLAAICASIVIVVTDIASTRIKTPKQAALGGQIEILGIIPNFPRVDRKEAAQK